MSYVGASRRVHRRPVRPRVRKRRRGVRDGEGGNGHRLHGRHAPTASDAKHHSSRYGGRAGNLWSHRICNFARKHYVSSKRDYGILRLYILCAPGGRHGVRIERPSGWNGNRDRGRCGRARHRAAGKALCWDDSNPHLRGSPGPVRPDRRPDPVAVLVHVRCLKEKLLL